MIRSRRRAFAVVRSRPYGPNTLSSPSGSVRTGLRQFRANGSQPGSQRWQREPVPRRHVVAQMSAATPASSRRNCTTGWIEPLSRFAQRPGMFDAVGSIGADPIVAAHSAWPHLHGSAASPIPSRQVGAQCSSASSVGHVHGSKAQVIRLAGTSRLTAQAFGSAWRRVSR